MPAAASSACLGGAVSGLWNQFNTGLNWDSRSFAGALWLTGRGNQVSQTFDRRFAAIDYKIQRQQLHREDIRDLVDLTTSRMDVYNLVGTLLLTFCITWFTDTATLDKEMPAWFADLFLISNFSAVGYLTMSVWMAMYAAVASKAIGTRLLTSYNRLALPVQDDLDEIKVPIFFPAHKVLACVRRLVCKPSAKELVDAVAGDSKAPAPLNCDRDRRSDGWVPTKDDLQHFRRFLHEVPRWLSHDTYSRVCMSLGMNQMLQALSYNVLSFIWPETPLSASLCFVGVKMLSIIIIRLDVQGSMGPARKRDVFALACCYTLPPIIAAATLWYPIITQGEESSDIHGHHWPLTALVIFFLHAGWLGYIASQLQGVERQDTRFRPGQFANVLEWVDHQAVDQDLVAEVQTGCKGLRDGMDRQQSEEQAVGVTSVTHRQSAALQKLASDLNEACAELAIEQSHHTIRQQLAYADQLLNYFYAWAYAPAVFANLKAFRASEVQRRLTSQQRKVVDESYQAVELMCRRLDLGMLCHGDLLEVAGEDMPAVRIDITLEGQQESEWIDPRTGQANEKEPNLTNVVSFDIVTGTVLPIWNELISKVKELDIPPVLQGQEIPAEVASVSPQIVDGGMEPGSWTRSTQVELKASTTRAPYKAVFFFSIGTMLWWTVCGLFRAFLGWRDRDRLLNVDVSKPRRSGTTDDQHQLSFVGWPEPAKLFRIEALHCNDSHVWISSMFASYSAQHPTNKTECTVSQLDYGTMNAVICGHDFCNSLRPAASRTHWFLESLGSREAATPVLPIPSAWRLVTGAWTKCAIAQSDEPCDEATLAGWDGSAVIVARMRRDQSIGAWKIQPRFALDPITGFCLESWMGCASWSGSFRKEAKYDDVKAFQLGPGGRTLTVLLGTGELHAWDLMKGSIIGSWRSRNVYTSMCHSGSRVFLSRQTAAGPVVDSGALPQVLASLLRTDHPPSRSEQKAGSRYNSALAPAFGNSRYHELKERRKKMVDELAQIDSLLKRW